MRFRYYIYVCDNSVCFIEGIKMLWEFRYVGIAQYLVRNANIINNKHIFYRPFQNTVDNI